MSDYQELRAWQAARELAVRSRPLIRRLPPEERFALADQWRRAAYSVVLNIAEGASRRGPREFRRYLDVARASLHEIETILDLVVALRYLQEDEIAEIAKLRADCARMVFGLLRSINARS
jgi:four helix bundle protein